MILLIRNFIPILALLFVILSSLCAYTQTNSVAVVTIKAVPGMRYDAPRFKVKPGSTVRIIFINEDEMSHNLLITEPGARDEIVKLAAALGEKGPSAHYIPKSAKVLWSFPLLHPGETKSITITLPDREAIYPYVCTFPGHGFIMYGAMYATNNAMPLMKDDSHIPVIENKNTAASEHKNHKTEKLHPYNPTPPYLYRILMPDAGPAAIAVHLPNKLSYCWDAGACRLRYAWSGEFIDPRDYWDKKGEPYAKILGEIYYRDKTLYPLRIGDPKKIPGVKFKGYKLVSGYPEFHYLIDGIEVFEMIRSAQDGKSLERTFRIQNTNAPVWFVYDSNDGVNYASSAGKHNGTAIQFTPNESANFTITMTKTEGVKL